MFNDERKADKFFQYINSQHPSIKFTCEKEVDGKLPFLDVLLTLSESLKFETRVYHKKTYTGLLTNYFSFTPSSYKIGLIRSLIDRIYKINNSWHGFHLDCKEFKHTMQKNSFPKTIVEKVMKQYLDSKFEPPTNTTNITPRYYKLPFIGRYSSVTQQRLNKIVNKYCKEGVSIKLVFTPFKIGSLFSLKCAVPYDLKSYVVYKFSCAGCNACYIGETTRHIATRIHEHLNTDKTSQVYKHLHSHSSIDCKSKCNSDCFTLLDSASTRYQLKIKESMHIEWEKPSLNKQVKSYKTSICI